jgi:hypothetical protein
MVLMVQDGISRPRVVADRYWYYPRSVKCWVTVANQIFLVFLLPVIYANDFDPGTRD